MEKSKRNGTSVQTSEKFKQKPAIIGCTIGSDCSVANIEQLKGLGVKHFQLLARFSARRGVYMPDKRIVENLEGYRVTIHTPFYFHLLQPISLKYRKYFVSLNNYWKQFQKRTCVIIHVKGINRSKQFTHDLMFHNMRQYAAMGPNLKILMENDAGGKAKPAPKLKELAAVRARLHYNGIYNVGVCVDTQHAYAAGDELFSLNYRKDVSMVHLNAIPKYVEFGKHLDRHSVTPLTESKNGTAFIKKILGLIRHNVPLVLERTDFKVLVNDIRLLKVMQNATLQDVDKKTMGKDIQKGRKILL